METSGPRCLVRQPRTFTHHTHLPRTAAEAHAVIRQVGEAKLIAGESALCPTLCVRGQRSAAVKLGSKLPTRTLSPYSGLLQWFTVF